MDKNKLKKECMFIVNHLFELAEVPIEKRQALNDTADKYLQEQFLRLFDDGDSFYCNEWEWNEGRPRCDEQCGDCKKLISDEENKKWMKERYPKEGSVKFRR